MLQEGLHAGQDIARELRVLLFPDLADISEEQEQAAIDTGEIQANCIAYVGCRG
jgi:hypothetical protein